MYRMACVLAVALVLVASGAARASDPTGGYLIADKVILDPSDAPTTIQIRGTFVLATEKGGRSYSDPVTGYLYFKAPKGKEDVCRKEWNDLMKAAGTTQVLGFGSSYALEGLGKVHKDSEKPGSPTPYPIGNGLVKINEENDYAPIRNLRGVPGPQSPGDGDAVAAGEVTLVVRNIAEKKHPGAKYVFTLEGASGGKEEATVEAGDKETRWTPKMKLKAGEKYTWRVRAVDGNWKGMVATSGFAVKGGK